MKQRYNLLIKSLKLVWDSAPGWATANSLISVIRSFLPLLLLLLLKNVIDEITTTASAGGSVSNIMMPLLLLAIVWFLDEGFADAGNYVRKKQSVKFEDYMYGLLHEKAVKADLINFENPEYYDNLSRASHDAPWRPNNILNNLISILRSLISLLLITGLIISFNWLPAALLVFANIPGIWLRLHYADILFDFRRKKTPEARKAAYFNWLLTGDKPSREIRLFGLGNYFRELFRRSFLKQKEEELEIIRKRTFIEILSDVFKASAIFIMIFYIADQAIEGSVSLGSMAMFLLAFRQGMIYMKELFGSLSGLYEDSLFIGDTFAFLDLKETIVAKDKILLPETLKESITVENLSFSYPGNEKKIIDNVSFTLNKDEVVAIVGHNGAGKSTLVRLISRLYDPDSGSVKFDGIDIKRFEPDEYRKLFSIIFQDFMLYNLTAGDNIKMGRIDHNSNDRMIDSARKSGAMRFIEELPGGFETSIGNLFDESRELSWGEWQKIALARALYRDSPILILDEPASALDSDTEYEIFSHFREIVKNRTTILISHRFTNVTLADRIIVMDHGRIAETGDHDELMARKGLYYSMYNKQSSRFEK
ncbi:MAG TPA: ABC transporter ATP-binding protein [Bacteroidales bacterium]|nr:ABC transporter ATP-binding protein [Bacteroidales bacterium]